MAARKRTIESAPTRPSESAREDLTTAITPIVTIVSSGKILATESESETDALQRRYRKRI